MRPQDYLVVQTRIARERENLGRLLSQMSKHHLYPEVQAETIGGFRLCDDEALRILGSMLNDFCTFVENVTKTVAARIDGGVPGGDDWHKELLGQMTLAIPGLRPPLLSSDTAALLDKYRGFGHVFRNIYGFRLDAERTLEQVRGLHRTVLALNSDLDQFVSGVDRAMQ